MVTPATAALYRKANKLNAHHMKTCAGFYATSGGRYFAARVKDGVLEISPDFGESWVDATDLNFRDHNGRAIEL